MSSRKKEEPIRTSTLDWMMIILYLALVLIGWINIYAASYSDTNPSIFDMTQYSGKQLLTISISIVVALMILLIDVKFYHAFAYVIYGLAIGLLIATMILAPNIKGAHAWLQIGGFQLQSSEFAKYAAALGIARFISSNNVRFNKLKSHLICWAMVLIPMAIILLQNDTGSALVFSSFILVFYREGLPGFWLILGVVLATIFVLALVVQPVYLVTGLGILLLPLA
jgi:rod shape determining protein RodA